MFDRLMEEAMAKHVKLSTPKPAPWARDASSFTIDKKGGVEELASRCSCHREAGDDSWCAVHPSCAECGIATTNPVAGCHSHGRDVSALAWERFPGDSLREYARLSLRTGSSLLLCRHIDPDGTVSYSARDLLSNDKRLPIEQLFFGSVDGWFDVTAAWIAMMLAAPEGGAK
jgi:hypothetical protein